MERPPDRIEVADAGVVLRRPLPEDIDALQATIEASRDHLRRFMPWADQDRAVTASFIDEAGKGWAAGDNFNYLVIESGSPTGSASERLLGGCGLHRRGSPDSLEIGYWLRPDAVGRGVMTAAAAALTEAAFAVDGVRRVEIRCDEANERSAAIPRRLGFRYVGRANHEHQLAGQSGQLVFAVERPPTVNDAAQSP